MLFVVCLVASFIVLNVDGRRPYEKYPYEVKESENYYPKNPCNPNPCQYSGNCQRYGNGKYRCICKISYYGRTCGNKRGICYKNPCKNGGTCRPCLTKPFYKCSCPKPYYGQRCQRNKYGKYEYEE